MKCTIKKGKNIDLLTVKQKNKIKNIFKLIETWSLNQKINFSWRHHPNGYKILVAEFFLQRTRASSADKAFKIFIKKYPYFKNIIDIKKEDLDKFFNTLGLKKRSQIFIKTIKIIKNKYNCKIPSDYKTLKLLPGVGDYIASAVLIFGFNKSEGLVDVNTIKFFSNIFNLKLSREQGKKSKFIKNCAQFYSSLGDPRRINWHLLDYIMINCKSIK